MRTPRRATLITVVGVALLLAADASWRATIPGVNEPHYLSKSRHFWIDTWCQRDLFAASTNAHWFFYAAVGWLAAVFPFPVAAWLGRIAGWSVLAWGWNRLGTGLIPQVLASTAAPCTPVETGTHNGGSAGASPSRGGFLDTIVRGMRFQLLPLNWSILFAAILWMAFATPNGLSGEWVIGGVESKVFAYGLLFAGLGNLLQNRLRWAGLQLGLSVAFHPLVGGWGVVALALSLGCDRVRLAICRWRGLSSNRSANALQLETVDTSAGQQKHSGLFAILPLMVASMPGMIPALTMLANVPSREIAEQGTRIQVLDRLPHHLLPAHFRPQDVQWSGTLLGVFLLGCWLGPRTTSWRLWRGGILGCAGIALAGLLADLTPWRISLLKFYPFRLIDGLLPCAAAWELVALWPAVRRKLERWILLLTHWSQRWPTLSRPLQKFPQHMTSAIGIGCLGVALAVPYRLPALDRVQPRWKDENRAAWREVCEWVRTETEPDALFLTPKFSFGFKWWGERAEYAVWKDCPQDAASLVEWKRRLDYVSAWRRKHVAKGFGEQAVAEFSSQTGVDYVVAWNKDPFKIEPIFRNPSFSVYRIRVRDGKPEETAP